MKNVEKVLAAIILAGLVFGWGVSVATMSQKADSGKRAEVRVQAIEVRIARMDERMERIPVIESKLDRLLGE